jgi:HAD superfamily hydrolase (TIGR01509 family)
LDDLLAFLRQRGVAMGVLSDYPALAKLEALGLGGAFEVVLCTTDRGVNAYKPHPAGFRAAAAAFRLPPASVLMVGDRADVDGQGAAAAGMPSVIVGRRRPGSGSSMAGCVWVSSLTELQRALVPDGSAAS